MASVCGGCLALMDAGVPLKAHVAGIAMGLIKDGNRFAVLTDILGDEDHLGDMDFKVAGTTNGMTACRWTSRSRASPKEIMQVALAQAKEAACTSWARWSRPWAAQHRGLAVRAAPVHHEDQPEDPRRDRQGRRHHPRADRNRHDRHRRDDGTITIASTDADKAAEAKQAHRGDHGRGRSAKVYEGPITKILDFGALVNILPGKDGLLHISQIAHQRVEKVTDFLERGQVVKVRCWRPTKGAASSCR